MGAKSKGAAAFLAFDVGKAAHRACAVGAAGEVLFNREVANRPADIDRALADAGPGARVVVDQKRNIGALVVARARAAGNPVSYLPGTAMKRARDMFPVTAKTDAIDAEVIARTAAGMPWTLREVAEEAPAAASLRMLAAQRDFAVGSRTRAANRLRAVLLEADPAFEAAVDPSSRWQLAVLAELGGPFGIRAAGLRRFRSVAERAHGAKRPASDRLWAAAAASASSGRPELAVESELVRSLAARVAADSAEAARLDALISDSLAGDEAYEALLTVPGVGPKTAAALVTLVDEPHKADVRDPVYLEAMALVNNLCSWLKRYLWRFTGMDPDNLQSYLNVYVYLFRVKRDDERWPKIARVVRHLFATDARFRSST
ncbi:MAG TPA: IS110 family transposase [Candidatus Coprousia avicola]|nr:IS110 family transposase [Candidatus Coprousia avicola]